MMRSVSFRKAVLAVVLAVFALIGLGCSSQLGETAAESNRRHKRVFRLNGQSLMADIDRFLLLDKPSRLTDKRIP